MEKSVVHKFYRFFVLLLFCGLLAGTAKAADTITLHERNGQTITGDIVDISEAGIKLKLPDDTYTPTPIAWGLMSQEDLQGLLQNPKAAPFAAPFIEIPRAEKKERSQIDPKPVPHLDRAGPQSLIGALGTSSMGVIMLLLVYAGNIYAGYEISVFRAQPAGLVCGVAAVLPIIGPAIFLAMPTRLHTHAASMEAPPDEMLEEAIAADQAQAKYQAAAAPARAQTTKNIAPSAAAAEHPSRSFLRGQFTFNRRFFETQVPGFFAVVRPEADKDMVLVFKSARGTHAAQRISRISPNEIYLQVAKGNASEEVIVPFSEIQEVVLKHKDAP
jgi:hypothetical protein